MALRKMPVKQEAQAAPVKFFRTIEQMSSVSGIGENTLRELIENREIDYISIGNRRLIAESAVWEWYERRKTQAIYQESEEVLCQSIAGR